LTIIFCVIECIFYARRILNPITALVFAVLKSLMWLVYFIISIAAAARGYGGVLGVILSLILVITSFVQMGFSAKYVHMKRKGQLGDGVYRRAGGVEGAGLNPGGVHYVGNAAAPGGAPGYEEFRHKDPHTQQTGYYGQPMEMQAQPPRY
jgi:hypothetical protein